MRQLSRPVEAPKYAVRVERNVLGTSNGGGPEVQFKSLKGICKIRKVGIKPVEELVRP